MAGRETDYQVVIADDAPAGVIAAADELVEHLNQVTGARFPIVRASGARPGKQIILGRTRTRRLPLGGYAIPVLLNKDTLLVGNSKGGNNFDRYRGGPIAAHWGSSSGVAIPPLQVE